MHQGNNSKFQLQKNICKQFEFSIKMDWRNISMYVQYVNKLFKLGNVYIFYLTFYIYFFIKLHFSFCLQVSLEDFSTT